MAMQFQFAKNVVLEPLVLSHNGCLEPYSSIDLSNRLSSSGINLEQIEFRHKTEPRKKRQPENRMMSMLKLINAEFGPEAVRVHAEVQILAKLLELRFDDSAVLGELKYIGCSKKSCWLCSKLLAGFYTVRASHNQVWPRWTIPSIKRIAPWTCLKIHARVSMIHDSMMHHLVGKRKKPLQLQAHSSPAVTEVSTTNKRRFRSTIDRDRGYDYDTRSSSTPQNRLGSILRAVRALQLPKDGSPMRLVSLPIRKTLKAYEANDAFLQHVPDFGAFWPGELNFERGMHYFQATNQASIKQEHAKLDGGYIIYFNLMEDVFGPNKHLQHALGAEDPENYHKFWNGDVFVVKRGRRTTRKTRLFPDDDDNSDQSDTEVDYDEVGACIYDDVSVLMSNVQSYILGPVM